MLIKGIIKVFDLIIQQAEEEYYSIPAIQRKLMELNILYEDEEISEDEYEEMQDILIERLLEAQQVNSGEDEEA